MEFEKKTNFVIIELLSQSAIFLIFFFFFFFVTRFANNSTEIHAFDAVGSRIKYLRHVLTYVTCYTKASLLGTGWFKKQNKKNIYMAWKWHSNKEKDIFFVVLFCFSFLFSYFVFLHIMFINSLP